MVWSHLFFLSFLHTRSPAAPPAGDGVRPECSLPACGRLPGHLQRAAQRAVAALRDRDHARAAAPAAAETRSVPAQHRPEGGLHTPAADTGHQHWVRDGRHATRKHLDFHYPSREMLALLLFRNMSFFSLVD